MADTLNKELQRLYDRCFPLQIEKIKSSDDPWITAGIRRKIRIRKAIFKQQGRSKKCHRLKRITDEIISKEKEKYYKRFKDKAAEKNNPGLYYKMLKSLKSSSAPSVWDVRTLFPGKSDKEIGETVAEFFNKISTEFRPLTPEDKQFPEATSDTPVKLLEEYEVSGRLKSFRKPKSQVNGDICP